MSTRITLSMAAAAALVAVAAGSAATAPGQSALVIRHEARGCHAWALNGGPFRAFQSIALRRGGFISVTDDDVMAHLLIQTSGPTKARIARIWSPMRDMKTSLRGPGLMAHMGAGVKVSFLRPGIYRFTTKAGQDYMAGIKTIGKDNVLRLTVKVG